MAAARHRRLRLRSGVPARWAHADFRRNDQPRETRPAAARARAVAPRPRFRQAGGDLPVSTAEGKNDAFGVYVHWPFCLSKCPYCDFNSHVRHAPIDEARFVRAFTAEIATTAARVPNRTVSTVFFGGGTPSLMQASTVGAILDAIAGHW